MIHRLQIWILLDLRMKLNEQHLIPEIVKNIGRMADPDNIISGDNQRAIAQKQLLIIEKFCRDLIMKYKIK